MRVSALGTAISMRLKEVASPRFEEWPDKVAERRLLTQGDARGEYLRDDPTRHQRRVVVELNEVQQRGAVLGGVEEDAELDVASPPRQGQLDAGVLPFGFGQALVDEGVFELEGGRPEAPA